MIKFKRNTTIEPINGHLVFFADNDNKTIPITVTDFALQDIDNSRNYNNISEIFESFRSDFEDIARQKINEGDQRPIITSEDVKK